MNQPKSAFYLAIDPGESTGWATFDNPTGDGLKGNLVQMGTCKSRVEVYDLLDDVNPDVIIMEDYKQRPGLDLPWDPFETVRVIGAVEHWAAVRKSKEYVDFGGAQALVSKPCRVVLQPNSIKSIGYIWAGMKPPKRKADTHEADAYVHGVYYLQSTGVRRPQQGKAPGR